MEEVQRLFSCIKEPCRTAVILDAVSGLRVEELLGLKWEDVRFDQLELNVTRSVSRRVVTPCKTEASRKPIPMNPEIADMLGDGDSKLRTTNREIGFSRVRTKRESNHIGLGRSTGAHLKPALLRAGISAKVGWHTLRHSFGTLMKANGEDLKTIQELLRHATFKVTADTYTQAVTLVKREADFGGRSRSKARHADNPVAYWTLMDSDSKPGIRVSSLESWRPRRDLNPCYRRERAMS